MPCCALRLRPTAHSSALMSPLASISSSPSHRNPHAASLSLPRGLFRHAASRSPPLCRHRASRARPPRSRSGSALVVVLHQLTVAPPRHCAACAVANSKLTAATASAPFAVVTGSCDVLFRPGFLTRVPSPPRWLTRAPSPRFGVVPLPSSALHDSSPAAAPNPSFSLGLSFGSLPSTAAPSPLLCLRRCQPPRLLYSAVADSRAGA